MSEAPRLYQLQVIDLDLDEKRHQLAAAEERLGETAALREARAKHALARRRAEQLEARIRQLEDDLDGTIAQIKNLQKLLFGGGIKKQQEAGAIEKELQGLKATKERIENALLAAMAEAEELPGELAQTEAEAQTAEATWAGEQEALRQEIERLRHDIASLEQTRQHVAASIPVAAMQTYEELRRTRRGRAVAKVERNTCQGCRVALPMGEVQHARTSAALAFCSFCGRILYVER